MRILVVGYSQTWKQMVLNTLPDEADIVIKGDRIEAAISQEQAPFDLYIFGNRLLSDPHVAPFLLEEAKVVKDTTPTIVFSQEFDSATESRIIELGAILIRSDTSDAPERLKQTVDQLLFQHS